MDPAAKVNPARLTRSLLARSRQGAIATLTPGSGDPYCSLVNVASLPDGAPVLLISRLALHTRNLLADPRVSLMLDERAPGDPLEGARIMVAGRAEEATGDAAALAQRRYLTAHPEAEAFAAFKDFAFFTIAPTGAHLVAGFGRIVDLTPDRFMTDLGDAAELVAAEPEVVAHMDADHAGTMALYAETLLGAGAGGAWRCAGCDPEGLDIQDGERALRLEFPRRIATLAALRHILKELAGQARAIKA